MTKPSIDRILEHMRDRLSLLSESATPEELEKIKKKYGEFVINFIHDIEGAGGTVDKDAEDELLNKIKHFDQIKNGLPADKRDLGDYTYKEFNQLVTGKGAGGSYKPLKRAEEAERPPDVVFKQGKVSVLYGAEDVCRRYGRGEKWCITKGSFTSYRIGRKKPTFYLVKDESKPASNKDSFFVIQVMNDGTFAWTDRSNQPYQRDVSSWSDLEARFPVLAMKCEEPGTCGTYNSIKDLMVYRKPTKQELGAKGISIEEWEDESPEEKLTYLKNQIANDNRPFSDFNTTWIDFFKDTLPSYKWIGDELVKYVHDRPDEFLKAFGSFTEKQQQAIIRNINGPNATSKLSGLNVWDLKIPMKIKALLYNAVNNIKNEKGEVISTEPKIDTKPTSDSVVYMVPRKVGSSVKNTLVKLKTDGDEILVSYQDESGEHKAEKLNKRNEDLLLKYDHLNDLDINKLTATVKKHNLDPNIIKRALASDAKGREIVNANNTYYLLQYLPNRVSVTDAGGARVSREDVPKEVIDKLAASVKSDADKRDSLLKSIIYNNAPELPSTAYTTILNSLSPQERTVDTEDGTRYIVAQPNGVVVFNGNFGPDRTSLGIDLKGFNGRYKSPHTYNHSIHSDETSVAVADALKNFVPPQTSQGVESLLGSLTYNTRSAIASNLDNIRLTPDNAYKLVKTQDAIYMVNKTNKDACKKYNFSSGNTVNLRLSQANYDKLLGREPQARQQTPAAQPAAGGALPAISQGGNVNLQQVFTDNGLSWTSLTAAIQSRLRQGGTVKNIRADRGTDTRNDLLRGRGRVTAAYQLAGTASALYIATLTSGRVVGIIAMQPGNIHGVVTGTEFRQYRSANDLPTIMQTNNINENMVNKKQFLIKLLERVIKENQPAPSKPSPGVQPGIAEPGTKEPEEQDPFELTPDQDVDTKPKASGKGASIEKKIINRAKSL